MARVRYQVVARVRQQVLTKVSLRDRVKIRGGAKIPDRDRTLPTCSRLVLSHLWTARQGNPETQGSPDNQYNRVMAPVPAMTAPSATIAVPTMAGLRRHTPMPELLPRTAAHRQALPRPLMRIPTALPTRKEPDSRRQVQVQVQVQQPMGR